MALDSKGRSEGSRHGRKLESERQVALDSRLEGPASRRSLERVVRRAWKPRGQRSLRSQGLVYSGCERGRDLQGGPGN